MNNKELQQDFKDDLSKIKSLQLAMLSAKEAYMPLVYFFLTSFLIFYAVIGLSAALLSLLSIHGRDYFYYIVSSSFFVISAISFFSTLTLGNYIVFRNMMIGEFKTAPFVHKKLKQMAVIFFSIYFVLVTVLFHSFCSVTDNTLDTTVSIVLTEAGSFLCSLFLINVVMGFEVQRLGLSSLFEVITAFFKHRDEQKKGLLE